MLLCSTGHAQLMWHLTVEEQIWAMRRAHQEINIPLISKLFSSLHSKHSLSLPRCLSWPWISHRVSECWVWTTPSPESHQTLRNPAFWLWAPLRALPPLFSSCLTRSRISLKLGGTEKVWATETVTSLLAFLPCHPEALGDGFRQFLALWFTSLFFSPLSSLYCRPTQVLVNSWSRLPWHPPTSWNIRRQLEILESSSGRNLALEIGF